MLKKHSLLRYFASLLSFVFGFSATVAAQYGVIETTYKINGNINELLSNIPIEGIKVSMKSNDKHETTSQSDSLGHFEFEMYRRAMDNTYYFTAEDIDGADHSGEYLSKDTTLRLSYEDFQRDESHGHWQIERNCRYEVNLKLQKAEDFTETEDPLSELPLDSNDISPRPMFLPKDTLLLASNWIAAADPSDERTLTEVYPNPTNGLLEIVIDARQAEAISLQLYDDTYKVLLERTEHLQDGNNHFTIDLKGYPSGNYLLVVICRDNRIVKKIIKI